MSDDDNGNGDNGGYGDSEPFEKEEDPDETRDE